MATLGAIKIPQGCDYSLTVSITDAIGAKNLTGYTARFRVSAKDLSTNYIDITSSVATKGHGTCLITDAAGGVVTVTLTPHTAIELPTNNPAGEESILQANNVYSISIIDATGKISKVIQNECSVEAEL